MQKEGRKKKRGERWNIRTCRNKSKQITQITHEIKRNQIPNQNPTNPIKTQIKYPTKTQPKTQPTTPIKTQTWIVFGGQWIHQDVLYSPKATFRPRVVRHVQHFQGLTFGHRMQQFDDASANEIVTDVQRFQPCTSLHVDAQGRHHGGG
jgi:hypothetical protein